ncbi:hypothetical protein [Nonomuraea sp. NPDC050783]
MSYTSGSAGQATVIVDSVMAPVVAAYAAGPVILMAGWRGLAVCCT